MTQPTRSEVRSRNKRHEELTADRYNTAITAITAPTLAEMQAENEALKKEVAYLRSMTRAKKHPKWMPAVKNHIETVASVRYVTTGTLAHELEEEQGLTVPEKGMREAIAYLVAMGLLEATNNSRIWRIS